MKSVDTTMPFLSGEPNNDDFAYVFISRGMKSVDTTMLFLSGEPKTLTVLRFSDNPRGGENKDQRSIDQLSQLQGFCAGDQFNFFAKSWGGY